MPGGLRRATLVLAIAVTPALLAPAAPALASSRDRSTAQAPRSEAAAAARTLRYWTPQRMRDAKPLEPLGGADRFQRPRPPTPLASASFLSIPTPDQPPYSVNGRIFLKQGGLRAYCSGTAINTPTRQLVLTAGHCVNSGAEPDMGRPRTWSQYLEFVPGYTAGATPFGVFVARRGKVYAPKQWINLGNPDFDIGAFLTHPNSEGVDVADAVGGGATIAMGLPRSQRFRTFGYPGTVKRMQACSSPYVGDDPQTFPFPGPPTMAIRCHWAPGASGGGWLINGGTEIDGINTYLHLDDPRHTYSPYFSQETVGKLVRGL
jgi:hypothetical protein